MIDFATHRWKLPLLCLGLAGVQGLIFAGAQLAVNGAFSFPLDDSFIHLQYAKQLARGEIFRYQDGQPVTSGATSILYAFVLAPGYALGFQGDLFLFWASLVALTCAALIFYLLVQIGIRAGYPRAGAFAWLLTWVSGLTGWGIWSGMEIALLACLILLAIHEILGPAPSLPRLFLYLGLLALCRPEGAIWGIVLGAVLAVRWISGAPLSHRRESAAAFLAALLFAVICLAGPSLFFYWATGNSSGNGLLAKSLLYHPTQMPYEILGDIVANAGAIVMFLMGGGIHGLGEFVLPGFLLFVVLGLLGWTIRPGSEPKWQALSIGLPLLAVLGAVATLEVWPLHNYRYLVPFFPLLFLLAVVGLESLGLMFRLNDSVPLAAGVALAALTQATYLPAWATRYIENSATILEKQKNAALWINGNLPAGQSIAINDAGVLAYYGQRPVYDLVGLVTDDTTLAYRMGEGGLYEQLERLDPRSRPDCAIVFPAWFLEMSRIYDVFYQPRVTFPDPFDPGFSKTLYRINWNYQGMEDWPRASSLREGWILKDRLDTADLVSESEHEYHVQRRGWSSPGIPVPFRRNFGYHEEIDALWPDIENERRDLIPTLRRQGLLYFFDIIDAGRRIDGGETFVLKNLEPHQDALLITRVCETTGEYETFLYQMDVYVNGIFVKTLAIEGTPWNWYEARVEIPGELIPGSTLSIRMVNRGSEHFAFYDSFYYWIYQENQNLGENEERGEEAERE
ncbi:MAG: hypothetical protein ACE15F_05050 [bacterium]